MRLLFLLALIISSNAHAIEMCVPTTSRGGAVTAGTTGTDVGNRATWTLGNWAAGEAHCSAEPFITADNKAAWEKHGINCYCRLTQLASPNGYIAPFDGAWARNDYFQSCGARNACASACASQFGTPGWRRVLTVSYNTAE